MKNNRFLGFGTALLLSVVVMVVCIFTIFRPIFTVQGEEDGLLRLTATGMKCEDSFGTEVRVESIRVNGESLDLHQLSENAGWSMDGELLSAYDASTNPAEIELPLKSVHSLEINLFGQCGSGILAIEWLGVREEIDLYRADAWETIQWSHTLEEQFAPLKRPDLLVELWGVICVLTLLVCKLFLRFRYRSKVSESVSRTFDVPEIQNDKYQRLLINFGILLLAYNVLIFNEHYSADSFDALLSGMSDINLSNGRPIHFLLYSLLELFPVPLYNNIMLNQIVLLIVISIISWRFYCLFMEVIDQTSVNSLLVQLASLLMFINVSFFEGWFYFPETCMGASLSLIVAWLAVEFWCRGFQGNKSKMFLGFIFLILSLNMYQVYIELFVIACTFYVLATTEGNLKRRDIVYEVQMVAGAVICAALNIVFNRFLVSLGIISGTNRDAVVDLSVILKNILTLTKLQVSIWEDFLGFMPRIILPVIGIGIGVIIIHFLKGKTKVSAIWSSLFILGSYITAFAPHIISGYIWPVPRTIYGYFVWIAGCVVLISVLEMEIKYKRALVSMFLVLLLVSSVQINRISVNTIAFNKIEYEIVGDIQRRINEYENETGVSVQTIVTGYDSARRYGYDAVDHTLYDTNVRAFAVDCANVSIINYHTGESYQKRSMTEDEYSRLFNNDEYSYLELDEQLKFEGDSAYLLIY